MATFVAFLKALIGDYPPCVGLLGPSINYTRVVHTPLEFAYCVFYVRACGISFCIPNYCSLIRKLTKKTITKVHTECHLPIYIPFLSGFCPKSKKYVE